MAYKSELGEAIGTGILAGLTSGNPLVGIASGLLSLFTGVSNAKAEDTYNAELSALAALEADRREAATELQVESNVLRHEQDTFAAERDRRAFSYRETMASMGVTSFAAQTGLSGSSIEKQAQQRLDINYARGIQDSIRSQELADTLFGKAQLQLEILGGITDPNNQYGTVSGGREDLIERPQPTGIAADGLFAGKESEYLDIYGPANAQLSDKEESYYGDTGPGTGVVTDKQEDYYAAYNQPTTDITDKQATSSGKKLVGKKTSLPFNPFATF